LHSVANKLFDMTTSSPAKFLNYKRYDLNESDATILERGGWLTSDVLNFGFACLCKKDGRLDHDQYAFLNPLTIMMITHGDSETVASIVEDCQLLSKELIFIPLNDASATSSLNRGTHWRLLVFSKKSKSFHLYDSSSSNSFNVGETDLGRQGNFLVERLAPFLVNSTKSVDSFAAVELSSYTTAVESCPQQENGYDCGMYVFCLVDLMCSAFSKNDHGLHSPHDLADVVKKNITPSYVTQKRIELYQEAIRLRGIWQKQLQTSATKAKTITKK
jgi:sentrin-specific protease 8